MKCNACGASWDETTINKTLLACPFCGELLVEKKPKKNRKKKKSKSMKDVLSEVVGLKGETVLEDRDLTIGLMSDLAPKMVKERRQLGMLYDIGAMKTVLSGCHQSKAEQQHICRKTMNQLMDELDMEADAAAELADEVCAALYGRRMDLRGKKAAPLKGDSASAEKAAASPSKENNKESEKKKTVKPKASPMKKSTISSVTGQQKTKSAPSGQSSQSSAVTSSTTSSAASSTGAASGSNNGSSVPAAGNGQTVTGAKPIISHTSTTANSGGRGRSVLAGASMVKSPQALQQAALPPKGQSSTSSQGNTRTTSQSQSSTPKKKRTRRSATQTKQSSSAQNTATNYNNTYSAHQNQSNWTPTPEQLQAYQHYTGKAYPQSAVPQSSGYQPWQPAGGGNAYTTKRTQRSYTTQQQTATSSPYNGLTQSAMNGDPASMYQLGLQYLRGTGGVVKDVNEALKWITGAANKGEENAGFMLGYLNYSGTEIPKNETEALRWFLKSVKSSDHEVQCLIGMIYAYGTTVTHNYSEAFKWFYKAGMGGSAQAQFSLGEFYHYGFDMEVNEREAANWYAKAARQGHPKAKQMVDQLQRQGVSAPTTTSTGPQLTQSQWSQIETAVQQAVQQQIGASGNGYGSRQQQTAGNTTQAQLPPQTQSWLNTTSRGATSSPSWQQRQQQQAQPESHSTNTGTTRSPGWRQNQNVGVVSSNRPIGNTGSSGYQSMPSESRYTLGQGYNSKVNRSLLQDDDDDWINLSKRRGFADSQT